MKNHSELFNKINNKFSTNTLLNCFNILNEWKFNIKEFDQEWLQPPYNYRKILLNKNHDMDMYLIIWNINAKTPIHDHSSNGCLLKVIQGLLKETLYDTNDIKTSNAVRILTLGSTGYLHNSIGYHKVENIHNDLSLSIHIYSPANYKTNYFKNELKK